MVFDPRVRLAGLILVVVIGIGGLWFAVSNGGPHPGAGASEVVPAGNEARGLAGGKRLGPDDIKAVQDHYPIPRDFNSPQVRDLKRRALMGDNRATLKISEYYDNCMGQVQLIGDAGNHPPAAECAREAHRWMEIAAQNGGNPVAAEYLFGRLIGTGKCVDVYRARYWLGRAMADPNKPQDFHIITDDDLRLFQEKEKSCRW